MPSAGRLWVFPSGGCKKGSFVRHAQLFDAILNVLLLVSAALMPRASSNEGVCYQKPLCFCFQKSSSAGLQVQLSEIQSATSVRHFHTYLTEDWDVEFPFPTSKSSLLFSSFVAVSNGDVYGRVSYWRAWIGIKVNFSAGPQLDAFRGGSAGKVWLFYHHGKRKQGFGAVTEKQKWVAATLALA